MHILGKEQQLIIAKRDDIINFVCYLSITLKGYVQFTDSLHSDSGVQIISAALKLQSAVQQVAVELGL